MTNIESMKNVRLGEVLVSGGYITEAQLESALKKQSETHGKRLGFILEEMGFVTERQKLEALGKRLGIKLINLDGFQVNVEAVEKIPRSLADKYSLLAIGFESGSLLIALNDPLNFFAIEDVRQAVKMPVTLCLSEISRIEHAINYYYSEVSTRKAVNEANLSAPIIAEIQEIVSDSSADDAPVVRLLSSLLIKGYNTNASDIHIEPFAREVNVRIRVDGTIVDYATLSSSVHQPLIARIKVLSGLDIAEKRVPQDGHFRLQSEDMDLNIRVSLVPTVYGEKAVLRFLSSNSPIDNAGTFGMPKPDYDKLLRAMNSPHGIIYLTGPTGSGKTTTLYMMLEYLAKKQVNIATIEDPVERNIARVNQMQVNNISGLTFDTGLRAILRQDPDIIMVGETRDSETATTSVRAAITGHLVLSTLHTNDAISAIVRLKDMGIPPYLIASSIVAVVAQRLVRKICTDCAYEYAPTAEEMEAAPGINVLKRGRGCPQCSHTGYKGRIAVHEVAIIDKRIREMITNGASNDDIFDYAHNVQKMSTLRESALELVRLGITTADELVKTAYYETV